MKYTLGSSAPSYIFHNQHKTLNNLYILRGIGYNFKNVFLSVKIDFILAIVPDCSAVVYADADADTYTEGMSAAT